MNGKVIAAGHICLDITPVFPAGRVCGKPEDLLIPGKLIRMEQADVHTGGSVANTDAGRADWRRILGKVLPDVDFFLPSFEELCYMLDPEKYRRMSASGGDMTERLDPENDVDPLIDMLMDMGCKTVVVKCGKAGMVWRTADEKTPGRDRGRRTGTCWGQ